MNRHRKRKNRGGYLRGPKHEHGGIAARVGGNEMIELEGGEYIVNAQTVNALGVDFLNKLNSTQTSYHNGGFGAGQLPESKYRNGGRVVSRSNRRVSNPVNRKRTTRGRGYGYQRGGVVSHGIIRQGNKQFRCPNGSPTITADCTEIIRPDYRG